MLWGLFPPTHGLTQVASVVPIAVMYVNPQSADGRPDHKLQTVTLRNEGVKAAPLSSEINQRNSCWKHNTLVVAPRITLISKDSQ